MSSGVITRGRRHSVILAALPEANHRDLGLIGNRVTGDRGANCAITFTLPRALYRLRVVQRERCIRFPHMQIIRSLNE